MMSECINDFYIFNEEVKSYADFEVDYPRSGKLLYEVIRIVKKAPLFLKEHFARLENSIEITGEKINLNYDTVKKDILKLIEVNNISEGNIKLVLNERCCLIFSVKHSYPTEEMYQKGVKTILYFGERENPNAKVINNNFRELVNEKLKAANAYEAILIDHSGNLTEGSKSNIFMLSGDKVLTAPLKSVLPGITRGKIIEACNRLGLQVVEEEFNYKNIVNLEGMFISGTSPKVLPIRSVEGEITFNEINDNIQNILKEYDKIIMEDLMKL